MDTPTCDVTETKEKAYSHIPTLLVISNHDHTWWEDITPLVKGAVTGRQCFLNTSAVPVGSMYFSHVRVALLSVNKVLLLQFEWSKQ